VRAGGVHDRAGRDCGAGDGVWDFVSTLFRCLAFGCGLGSGWGGFFWGWGSGDGESVGLIIFLW